MEVENRSNAKVRAVRLGFHGWRDASSPIVSMDGVAVYDETAILQPGQSRIVHLSTNSLPDLHWYPGKAARRPLTCVAVSAILENNRDWQNSAITCGDGERGACLVLPIL
jgi:hypothetical protein